MTPLQLLEARAHEASNLQTDIIRLLPTEFEAIISQSPGTLGWAMNVFDGEHRPFWRDALGTRWRIRIGLEIQGRFHSMSAVAALLGGH